MIVFVLVFIIFLLFGFIVWLMKSFFVIVPREEKSVEDSKSKPTSKPAEKSNSSIVGKTKSRPLQRSSPKPKVVNKAQVPPEEIENTFNHLEIKAEYREPSETESTIPSEEQSEVIDTGDDINSDPDNEQLQKSICLDYHQMDSTTKKIVRNIPLDITDAETMRKLEGTEVLKQMERAMPQKLNIVREYISKVEQ